MKCSIIILNWNGADMLRRYLPSVLTHTTGADYQIVVADNGSTDDSLSYLQSQPVRLITLDKNYGFAQGYNLAIQQVDSQYVVLLNSDVEVTPHWLDTLCEYMDDNPDVTAVQPKVLSWLSHQQVLQGNADYHLFEHAGAAGGYMDALGYPYCRGRMMSYVEEDRGQYDTITPIFWATGACLMIRREQYLSVGGLDADFFAHQEEIDLCWRLQCRGGKLMCVPQSVVYHLGGGALNYSSPRKTYLNFRNNLLMLFKNLPSCRLHGILLVRFFMDYVAAAQMLLTGQWGNVKAVFSARWAFQCLRRSFRSKRQLNLRAATISTPSTISHRSIVFDFYIKHQRS